MPLLRGDKDPDALAEERRLFYVSLTRAKTRLRLTHTMQTSLYGPQSRSDSEPSRFLGDVLRAGHAVLRQEDATPQAPPGARHAAARWSGGGGGRAGRSGSGVGGGRAGRTGADGSSGGGGRKAWTRVSISISSMAESSGIDSSSVAGPSGGSREFSQAGGTQADPPLTPAQERARKRGGRR